VTTRVDCQDHGLGAEFPAELGDEFRASYRGGVHRNLIRARHEDEPGIGHRSNTSAYGERDEDLARGSGHDIRHGGAGVA
jgi:hypothetical protein